MPDRTAYEPGTPCWVDLVTPDPEAAAAFYTGLFGWDAKVDSPDGHTMLSLGGRPVAALMPHVAEAAPGTPALWTTYVSVTDVEATSAAAVKAGGRLFTGPADAGEHGRFALLFDSQNAHIGLWQPAGFHGASLVNEPGSYAVRAGELGGTVSVPPSDMSTGRFSVLGDPQGGYFSVIRLNG